MSLAPIVVMTYSRVNHLKSTVNSLLACKLANESDVYFLLDAPRKGDEDIVAKVRNYLKTIQGFRNIEIIERELNNRLLNYVEGVQYILNKYGMMIFLEDDNVVSSNFLVYMNDALQFYKNDERILAINGYNVPVKYPSSFKDDYYFSYYFNAWGFATWLNRSHLSIEQNRNGYKEIMNDTKLFKKVMSIHPELLQRLKRISEGGILAGDFNLTYYSIKYNKFSIHPTVSLVNNIGFDGSGMNCKRLDKFENDLNNVKSHIVFNKDIRYNREIDLKFYQYFHPKSLTIKKRIRRIVGKIKKLLTTYVWYNVKDNKNSL